MTGLIEAALYAADGTTFVDLIRDAVTPQWLDELNGTGSASLQIPTSDPAATVIDYLQIVKLTYAGGERFAFLVEAPSWNPVDPGGEPYVEVTGRGVLALLEAAKLLPYGAVVSSATPDQRFFNFASADSFAHDLGVTWSTPVAVKHNATGDLKAGYPVDWPDATSYWIWATDPESPVVAGTENWFSKQFTLSADAVCRIYATADDFFDLLIDGDLVLTNAAEFFWKKTGTVDVVLAAGTHVIAIHGTNTTRVFPANVAGVMADLVTLDAAGAPDANIVHTDSSWRVSTTEPSWTAGDVLHTVFTEAKAFGWGQLANVTIDFTDTLDSNGATWTTKVSRPWNIVTTSLLSLVTDLCALGINVWMTPDLVLHAAETRGTTTTVTLSPSGALDTWKISGRAPTGTYGWVRTETGWVAVQDTAGVAAHGKIGLGIATGNSDSDSNAAQVAAAAFASTAAPLETVTDTTIAPTAGATAYVDFNIGDTVHGPGKTGAATAARLLSITVTADRSGQVTYRPELSL